MLILSISWNFSTDLGKHSQMLSRSMSPQWFLCFQQGAVSQHEFVFFFVHPDGFYNFPRDMTTCARGLSEVFFLDLDRAALIVQEQAPLLRAGARTCWSIVVTTLLLELTFFLIIKKGEWRNTKGEWHR